MKLFSKKRSPGWFALRTSAIGTCVTHVIHSEAKPTVEFSAIQQESLKDDHAVKSMVTNLSMANLHCSLLLAQSEYQLFQIEKPNVPADELKQAISWKLKDMLDYPVDQATIDVINIPVDPNNSNRQSYVYAVAAKNSVIGDYMTEINVTSPTGIRQVKRFGGADIAALIWDAIEARR